MREKTSLRCNQIGPNKWKRKKKQNCSESSPRIFKKMFLFPFARKSKDFQIVSIGRRWFHENSFYAVVFESRKTTAPKNSVQAEKIWRVCNGIILRARASIDPNLRWKKNLPCWAQLLIESAALDRCALYARVLAAGARRQTCLFIERKKKCEEERKNGGNSCRGDFQRDEVC